MSDLWLEPSQLTPLARAIWHCAAGLAAAPIPKYLLKGTLQPEGLAEFDHAFGLLVAEGMLTELDQETVQLTARGRAILGDNPRSEHVIAVLKFSVTTSVLRYRETGDLVQLRRIVPHLRDLTDSAVKAGIAEDAHVLALTLASCYKLLHETQDGQTYSAIAQKFETPRFMNII